MIKIAYITSGKVGIHRFTYNELVELENQKIDFVLCLTQLKNGPWMPLDDWKLFLASKKKALKELFFLFFNKMKLVFLLLYEAQQKKVLPYFLISISLYSDLKKDHNISSLHCQMGDKKLYIGYFLKRLMNLPLTVTVHAHELYQRQVYNNNNNLKNLFSQCDKIITISEFNKNIINSLFEEDFNKIEVIRLFPEIDYQNKVKNKIRILIVANWAEKKGYKILFEAISKIERDDFVLWVVGGSYFSVNSIELNDIINEYHIENKVALLGRQGDVLLDIIFSACDIFCLPSYTEYYDDGRPAEREGIPVALMEAMAWGKPVISTKHAGIPELLEEILVEERNVNELRSAIEFLLDNPSKWAQMGEKNQKIISSKYSKKNVTMLADIFKSLSS